MRFREVQRERDGIVFVQEQTRVFKCGCYCSYEHIPTVEGDCAPADPSGKAHVAHLPRDAPPSHQPPPRLHAALPILRTSLESDAPLPVHSSSCASCTISTYSLTSLVLLRAYQSLPLPSLSALLPRQPATMNAPAVHRAPAFVALGGGAFRGAAMVARPAAAAICGAPVLAPVTAAPLVVVDGLPALGGDVTMRCRRNLKLEKRARNRANGRTFKKSKPRFFNRRSAVDTTTDKDTEFLSSIFNVLTFDARSSATTDDRKKGGNKDRRPRKD